MKLAAAALLALACNSAVAAEWELAHEYIDRSIYIHTDTVMRPGSSVKLWTMQDFKVPRTLSSQKSYLSAKFHEEFSCVSRQSRALYMTFYSGQMGRGDVVATLNEGASADWHPVVPSTVGADMWKIVCDRR